MAAKPPRHEAVGVADRPLGEPGRSRRPAPRARESDALPVTQAEREPAAPSGSRRRAPTTARDRRSLGPLAWRRSRHGTGCRQRRQPARQRRARTPQGAKRPRSTVRKTQRVFRQCGKSEISRLQSESAGFWHHHERASLSRTTASPGQRGDGVASSRASGPCEAVSPPRIRGAERRAWPASSSRACRGLSGPRNSLSEHYRVPDAVFDAFPRTVGFSPELLRGNSSLPLCLRGQ